MKRGRAPPTLELRCKDGKAKLWHLLDGKGERIGMRLRCEPSESFFLHGSCDMVVKQGAVDVFGHIVIPRGDSAYTVRLPLHTPALPCQANFDMGTIVELYNPGCHTSNVTSKDASLLQDTDDAHFLVYVNALKPHLEIPQAWAAMYDTFAAAESNRLSIAICGQRNAGKSMLCRFLVNKLLNSVSEVYYMDTDLGQSELFPSGTVGLYCLTRPLLSAPPALIQEPLVGVFVGSTSPAQVPMYYMSSVESCLSYYWDNIAHNAAPLIINTHGWTNGIGLEMLQRITHLEHVTDIVELVGEDHEAMFADTNKTHHILEAHSASSCDVSEWTPALQRSMMLVSYFSQPYLDAFTLSIPLDKLSQKLCQEMPRFLSFDSTLILSLLDGDMSLGPLQILNGTLVALCHTSHSIQHGESLHLSYIDDAMHFFPQCLGYGIIRGCDTTSRTFTILTPISPSRFGHVNCIIKGRIELPQIIGPMHHSDIPPPYSATLGLSGAGTARMKSRGNISRYINHNK